MSERRLFGVLSGAQVTILGCAAMLSPSAVLATAILASVSVTDPNSGVQAHVDAGRRLFVFDPVAGWQNNPANIVNIDAAVAQPTQIYTVPAGKVLILRSINWSVNGNTQGIPAKLELWDAASSNDATARFHVVTINGGDSGTASLAAGIVIKAGAVFLKGLSNNTEAEFTVHAQGYLIPAAAI